MKTSRGPEAIFIDRDEVKAGKEALLRQIDHLRQRVDYDYPPRAVAEDMKMVRVAFRSYRDVWHEAQRNV